MQALQPMFCGLCSAAYVLQLCSAAVLCIFFLRMPKNVEIKIEIGKKFHRCITPVFERSGINRKIYIIYEK